MELLTVKEVSELKGCSVRYIRKCALEGKIKAMQEFNTQNNKPQYMIPISSLPMDLQNKYYSNKKAEAGVTPALVKTSCNSAKRCFEDLTEEERKEVNFWNKILIEWQVLRAKFEKKTEVDPLFVAKCKLDHPDRDISTDILYRKLKAQKENDFDGIIGKRGGWNKETTAIPGIVWCGFLWFYLDPNKPTVSRCYQLVKEWTKEFYPEEYANIPSEQSFRRNIKTMAKAVLVYMRDGEKALSDRCLPYITRMYDELHANDVWIADNHTLDVQSVDGNGAIHRLHLTAFLDAKTGVLVGWNITDNPCSQSTIVALRHGIKRFGIPKMVYFDNGSEFLTHDVGGRGHRTRKDADIDPPTILQHLDIEMRNALVRNAKAKPIERTFYTLKNQFSKAFEGFCGGTILERPESLKRVIKEGRLPMDTQIREFIDVWADGDFNLQEYGGAEKQFQGMSRLDVWNEDIRHVGVRKAAEDDLNLMLMRSSRFQKVKRNGVYVDIFGEKIFYFNPDTTWTMLDKEVYVRYDPADLRSVRLYEKETDKYIATWQCADSLMMDYITENKQEISDGQAIIRRTRKFIKDEALALTSSIPSEQRLSMLDMTLRKARAARDERFRVLMPKKIIPLQANEKTQELIATGTEGIVIDLNKMSRNAEKRKE